MIQKPGALRSNQVLYVITPISNPVRYHSRIRLLKQFRERLAGNPHVQLRVVEVAFGDRHHDVTEPGTADLQLRSSHELWCKEAAINLMVQRLPADWRYMAWVDGDVEFTHRHWVEETLHQLQHYAIVQMWRNAIDLGPAGNTLQLHTGFGYLYRTEAPGRLLTHHSEPYGPLTPGTPREFMHPGYAWACTREAYDAMGGLIDWAIAGSADHHMATAWIGEVLRSVPSGISEAYRQKLLTYQEYCEQHIKRNIGYVEGTLLHHHHGPKQRRFYTDRWSILQKGFDPDRDLRRDAQGLYQLNSSQLRLRDDLRTYFRARDEDSIEE